jgi:hypothetical protein
MIQIFLDKKNKVTISVGKNKIVKYIPTKDQRKFINKLFDENKLLCYDKDGNEKRIPVIIHDNVRKLTTTISGESIHFADKYIGVPNGVRYRPDKLITYEKDRQEWLLDRVKRTFISYDNENLTSQQFKTEMRLLLNRR